MAPTYRLLWGIPGRSNALAIAERLGLQSEVVDDARMLLDEEGEGVSMEAVLTELQSQRNEQRARTSAHEHARARGAGLRARGSAAWEGDAGWLYGSVA
jgi:DNA mismatch repair protein MutS2